MTEAAFTEVAVEVRNDLVIRVRVPNADAVLAAGIDDPDVDVYAHTLWASGVAAARAVADIARRGDTVIDVGAGLGIASLAAASLGCSVTALDHDRSALIRLADAAAAMNLRVDTMDFDIDGVASLPHGDIIVFSDLLYELPLAVATARRVAEAASRSARVVITDPGRIGRDTLLAALRARSFDVAFSESVVVLAAGDSARVGIARIG